MPYARCQVVHSWSRIVLSRRSVVLGMAVNSAVACTRPAGAQHVNLGLHSCRCTVRAASLRPQQRQQQQHSSWQHCPAVCHRPRQRRLVHTAAVPPDASLQGTLYQLSQYLDGLVQAQLSGVTPVTFGVVFLAGLGTSLSPCTLSVLPLTIGYIGGYAQTGGTANQQQLPESKPLVSDGSSSSSSSGGSSSLADTSGNAAAQAGSSTTTTTTATTATAIATPSPTADTAGSNTTTTSGAASTTNTATSSSRSNTSSSRSSSNSSSSSSLSWQAVSFSLGLASTLAGLGVVSSLLGQAYGAALGDTLPVLVGATAVVMGLNLLEVVQLRLPSLDVDVRGWSLPRSLQAYFAGATFALAASPCSTPVLASLLGWVTTTRDPVTGGALLLCYSCGYVTPLLVAASATGAVREVVGLRRFSTWITPASGVLLLAGGTYTLLNRLLPAV